MLKKYLVLLFCSFLAIDAGWDYNLMDQGDRPGIGSFTKTTTFESCLNQLKQIFFGEVCKPRNCYFIPGSNQNVNFSLLEDALSVERQGNKIEKITHTIWFTREKDPVDLPEKYRKWLENSVETNQDFKHWLWTSNKNLLSCETIKALEEKGIEIKEVEKDLDNSKIINLQHYKNALHEKKFANASDIMRLEILFQHGGFYKDTDYEMLRPFRLLHKLYDSYSSSEPWHTFIGTAAIGAKKHHPIVYGSLQIIARNYSSASLPLYLSIFKHCNFKFSKQTETIIKTGPGVLTISSYKNANVGDFTDIIFPYQYLYPSEWERDYRNLGVHYWEGSWTKGKYGNSIGSSADLT